MNEDREDMTIKTGLEESDVSDYEVNLSPAAEDEDTSDNDAAGDEAGVGRRRGAIYFLLGLLFGMGIVMPAAQLAGLGRFVPEESYKYYENLNSEYGKYAEIMRLIGEDPLAKNEVGSISDDELKALVASTGDPYAQYFTAAEYLDFEKTYLDDYVGIGVGVLEEDGNIVIKSVFRGEPAEEAGIKAEDILKTIDGKEPKDVDDAVAMMSGDAGTTLMLGIQRAGELMEFEVTRREVKQESVAFKKAEGHENIGYIMIAAFRKNTEREFKNAVKDLKSEGCDRFIIDLRGNGGGLTDTSIAIADYLLPECKIMSEKKKDGTEIVKNSKESSAGLEYVVLTDGDTASASEILTAAVKDNKGGKIIGSRTFGKGVTQLSRKFKDGSAIKITNTEYFRPNGKPVNGVGIEPDIETGAEEAYDRAIEELEK